MASYIFALTLLLASLAYTQDTEVYAVYTLINTGTATPPFPLPSLNWEEWDEKGSNELTAMGMREQYLLGRELRRLADQINLLDPEYLIDQVFVRMIDHNSSIESGVAFLRGFMKDNKEQLSAVELSVAKPPVFVNEYFIRNIGSNVLPMGFNSHPYHTHYPHEKDIFAPCSCPPAQKLTKEAFVKSEEVKKITEKYEPSFVDLLKKYYAHLPHNLFDFPKYIPILESVRTALRLFKETRFTHEEELLVKSFADELLVHYKAGNRDANSYRASPVIEHMLMFLNMSLANSGKKENMKTAFIFGEDRIMTSFLRYLNENMKTTMPPSSIISLQVSGPKPLEKVSDLSVTLIYNTEKVPIPGCEGFVCKYEKFVEEMRKLIVKEVDKKCAET